MSSCILYNFEMKKLRPIYLVYSPLILLISMTHCKIMNSSYLYLVICEGKMKLFLPHIPYPFTRDIMTLSTSQQHLKEDYHRKTVRNTSSNLESTSSVSSGTIS